MKNTIILAVLIILFFGTKAQNFKYDIKYTRLEIDVDPEIKYINGVVTYYFTTDSDNFNEISFDFEDNMIVDSVILKNLKQNFILENDYLNVFLSQNVVHGTIDSISVYYQGEPSSSGFGSFETSHHNNTPIMWTLSEPYGAKSWMPCKQSLNDKADSLDMYVTVPIGNKVAGNGLIVNIDTIAEKVRVHWKHRYPITAYLIAFAVTNYEEYYDYINIGDSIQIPVLNYVYPENLELAKQSTPDMIDVFQFYCDTFMLYPFWDEKYGHAQFNRGGGMEHQTMTFLNKFTHYLMAHELAHQWFGDYITCGSWHDIWLNEGFAVYLEGLTAEQGLAPYDWYEWKSSNISAVTSNPEGSVYCDDTTSVARIFNYRLTYQKGGMILHLLRWVIGDKAFFDGIRNYLHDPELAYGYATADDLKKHFEKTCDCDLTYFFDDWYYGEGFPVYSIYWSQNYDKHLILTIYQSQSTDKADFFQLPIPIKLTGMGKDTLFVLNNTYSGQKYELNLDFYADNLIFDPEKWIITNNTTISGIILSDENKLFLNPNPVKEELSIRFPYELFIKNYTIYDTNGKQILSEEKNKNIDFFKINVSNLLAGCYVIYINSEKGTYTEKFIKE